MKTTKARKAAYMQDCTLRIPGTCNWNPETTVLAHLGTGTAKRRDDLNAVYACSDCHDAIDGRTKRFWDHDPAINEKLREDRLYFIEQAKNRMQKVRAAA